MPASENTNELAAALAKAQAAIINPAKDSENPHFKSKYADLAAGLNVIRPALASHGIAYTQLTRVEGDILMLDTRLTHSSGQWIESEFPVCKFPAPPQQIGSALSYSRRYSLFAMVGVAGEDDDDGNEANKTKTEAPRRDAPHVAKFAPEDSRRIADVMIGALEMATTRDELLKWAKENSENKARLLADDAAAVTQAFNTAQAALKQQRAA